MTSPRKRTPDRQARARTGYFAGVLLIAVGVGWQLGPGWGAAALGAGVIVFFVVLFDVDPDLEPVEREDGPW